MAHDPRYATMTARVTNRAALDGAIAALFARHSKDAMAQQLKAAGIAFGMLNTIDGLISHPQLRTITYETADGRWPLSRRRPKPTRRRAAMAQCR